MLNPGYTVLAKKKKIQYNPQRGFVCPECKKTFLEVDLEPDAFRTKCSNCGSWVFGKKNIDKSMENKQ